MGDKRTEKQTALLKEYPNIQNINEGSLYLYSEQRGRRANEIAKHFAEVLRLR